METKGSLERVKRLTQRIADDATKAPLSVVSNRYQIVQPREVTAAIILHSPRLINQVIYTAGDTITYGALADLVERVIERKVERRELSVQQLLANLAEKPDDNLRKHRAVFAMGRGVAWDVERTFNVIHGLPVTSAEKWAQSSLPRG